MTTDRITRRLTVTAVLVVLLVQASAMATDEAPDYKSALALAARQDKPLVLDFFTEW